MKHIRIILATVLLVFSATTICAAAVKLRVMSFNIRVVNSTDAPENQWDARADRLCAYINDVKPDLLGMQEVVTEQRQDIEARITGYTCLTAGRDNGRDKGEATPIFYCTDKFDLISSGHFWLSETPEEPSYGWNAACRRIALWAIFEYKKNGERFIYCNTHFDHVSVEARKESAKLLKDRIQSIAPDLPFILSADFNTNESEETYSLLLNHSYTCVDTWKAAKKTEGGPGTFNNWGKAANKISKKIDFIFTSTGTKVTNAVIAPPANDNGAYFSDHNAIYADLQLRTPKKSKR